MLTWSKIVSYLILVHVLGQLRLTQLVEGDDDQGHEDVDEEEGEDDEIDDIKDGHFRAKPGDRTLIFVGGGHGIQEDDHPSFRSLYGEEGHHGGCTVVIVEGPNLPFPGRHLRNVRRVLSRYKELAPNIKDCFRSKCHMMWHNIRKGNSYCIWVRELASSPISHFYAVGVIL